MSDNFNYLFQDILRIKNYYTVLAYDRISYQIYLIIYIQ